MQTFATMEERHAFGLEALAEMTGKLVQATYMRATFPRDPDDQDRAILLFDRMARSFRLTLAMESREARARRQQDLDAADQPRADASPHPTRAAASRPPRETEGEDEDDVETPALALHIRDIKRAVVENADIVDPDGAHARTLDHWEGAWGDVLFDKAPAHSDASRVREIQPMAAAAIPRSRPRRPPRHASG